MRKFHFLHIFILNLIISTLASNFIDTRRMLLARQKRTLIWQEGINWVQMIAGIGLPVELKDQSLTLGAVVKSYYLLPNNSTYYTHPTIVLARKNRNAPTRWKIYDTLIRFIERFGYSDGKACLLRAICEISSMPFDEKTGLFAEILQILFKPSSTKENTEKYSDIEYKTAEKLGKEVENCHVLFRDCKISFLTKFTKFL